MSNPKSKIIWALIPARGGSKGIPRKNIRPLAGKPLLAHTVEQALAASQVSRVIVSTDDEEIGAVAQHYGAEVVWRPAEISGDTATSESALRHALDALAKSEGYEPDLVLFLQCTSPLRRPGDIDQAIQTLVAAGADSLLSVVPSHRFLWRVAEEGQPASLNYDYRHRPRRQDRPPEYVENGSIYLFKPWVLRQGNNRLGGKIALYVMDEWSAIDVDSPADWQLCECLLAANDITT
ncbi:MAG: acylneuraminate cytidylyltransferase family protein [Chloroflexi bacterium]|nr:acylneuraminate cytidylyltransferase family protein [Chloroflexota bacterium]MCI0579679.1 acylneuraminate cytidylyltransferase family protein [Chloroflexota bacterium]MCI0645881.1 acylneuraminate cytidylyltransferase family protein [Chloroflexota bacterium]MCI0725736.1 acylneuraminate cytidylyltransferase family protein [Chloroflexota bacterium]